MKDRGASGFLDTSVLVRYVTGDPPHLAERAARLLDSVAPLVLSEIALLEAAHVLSKIYQVPRPALVDTLVDLVQKENLRLAVLPKARIIEALYLCRDSNRFSLPDMMLWAQAREMQVGPLYSFDRRFPNQGLTVLQPD